MGKTKSKAKSGTGKDILHGTGTRLVKSVPKNAMSSRSVEDLLSEAAELLEQSQPELALPLAEEALRRLEQEQGHHTDIDDLLQQAAGNKATFPQALVLGAEINLALGVADAARLQFLRATRVDPDGALISAEPYLWLSQLAEDGGEQSIIYFEKAAEVLRNEIDVLEDSDTSDIQGRQIVDEKRAKLANALCGMTEVYMTDLSWEDDAENRCERYITEALAICPERLSAGVLQTLASVRISQERIDEARRALASSVTIWKDMAPEVEDPARPDFATRVSLARLLMEVEVETDALLVLEGLAKEDDQSVEVLYLGGWCHVLLSKKHHTSAEDKPKHEEQARLWLGNCLKLYRQQDYEDEKLKEHALELVSELNEALGITGDDDEWEDAEDDEDNTDDDLEINGDIRDGDVEMT